jgi:hypothetical protein
MTTHDLVTRRIESAKRTQDAIDKIARGQLIETYVIAGFSLIVMVIVFIALF